MMGPRWGLRHDAFIDGHSAPEVHTRRDRRKVWQVIDLYTREQLISVIINYILLLRALRRERKKIFFCFFFVINTVFMHFV